MFPEAEEIFERNLRVQEDLGMKGWGALDVGAHSHGAVAVGADTQPATETAQEDKTA